MEARDGEGLGRRVPETRSFTADTKLGLHVQTRANMIDPTCFALTYSLYLEARWRYIRLPPFNSSARLLNEEKKKKKETRLFGPPSHNPLGKHISRTTLVAVSPTSAKAADSPRSRRHRETL